KEGIDCGQGNVSLGSSALRTRFCLTANKKAVHSTANAHTGNKTISAINYTDVRRRQIGWPTEYMRPMSSAANWCWRLFAVCVPARYWPWPHRDSSAECITVCALWRDLLSRTFIFIFDL